MRLQAPSSILENCSVMWLVKCLTLAMEFSPTARDIEDLKDLELLITRFYQRLLVDPLVGHFFTEVVQLDLERHIPRIAQFWESTLFQTGGYQGDPMGIHLQLHSRSPMESEHFAAWLGHFSATVDEMYMGRNAELAKQRAYSIATLMQVKIKRAALGS
jgi:hemoglobin